MRDAAPGINKVALRLYFRLHIPALQNPAVAASPQTLIHAGVSCRTTWRDGEAVNGGEAGGQTGLAKPMAPNKWARRSCLVLFVVAAHARFGPPDDSRCGHSAVVQRPFYQAG